jgi:hypothetical protein
MLATVILLSYYELPLCKITNKWQFIDLWEWSGKNEYQFGTILPGIPIGILIDTRRLKRYLFN